MKKFKASLYLRLSKEDDKNAESESIINQKIMLTEFINKQEDIELISIKIDDGYSGSNFDRPAFNELIEDIKKGNINCIVVKDFSRFGRDFIEVGRYLEEIFPFMNVRFISINDNYDSLNSKNSIDNLMIPFKNLINDSYLRDISLKIRSSLDSKRKKGDFIGAFATYGYLKDPNNKNKLIVDESVSKVVKEIFNDKINGLSGGKIAEKLNENGILSPLEHKKSLGLNYKTGFKKNVKSLWTAKAVLRILENPVYIGTLEQKKKTTPNHKIKKMTVVKKEDRIIVENNHEPIIEKTIFHMVQDLMKLDTRIAPNQKKLYKFSGSVYCAECGSNLIRKNNGTKDKPYIFYVCNNAKNKLGCVGSNIKESILEEIVFSSIREHINNILDLETILNKMENLPYTTREIKKIDERLNFNKQQLEKYQNVKFKLYEDLKDELLTKQEYEDFKNLYNSRIKETKELIAKFEREIENLANGTNNNQHFINHFKKYKNIEKLSREIVVNLIEKIEVHRNKEIDIYFKYEDKYIFLCSYLENIEKLDITNG